MTSRQLVVGAAAGLVALNVAAFCTDCVRLAGAARARVELADADMRKAEERLAKILEGAPEISDDARQAVAAWRGAEQSGDGAARREAYDRLVAAARSVASPDPTAPLARKFADETAGAINRRTVAEKPFEEEATAYRGYLKSFRGKVAQWILSDSKPVD